MMIERCTICGSEEVEYDEYGLCESCYATHTDRCERCSRVCIVADMIDGECADCAEDSSRERWIAETADRVVDLAESLGWDTRCDAASTGSVYITCTLCDDDCETVDEVIVRVADHASAYCRENYSIVWPGARQPEHTIDQVRRRLEAPAKKGETR